MEKEFYRNEKTKETLKTVTIVIICLIILACVFYVSIKILSEQDTFNENSQTWVIEVIDGDTFKLFNGEIVRLLCVDTPEKGEEGYDGAVSYLGGRLFYNLEYRLRLEGNTSDKYGRLLRWVWLDDTSNLDNESYSILINKEIIDLGYGDLFEYDNEDCSLVQ